MKTSFVHLILAVFCFVQLAHSQSECPQGWTLYRDEKCYFLQTLYLSYESAQSVCATRGGTLASVKEEAQQTFLTNYLFNESSVEDEVWLGATRVSPTEFQWEDGTPVEYSNWGPESPSDNEARSCVAMQSKNSKMQGIEGSWRDVPCTRPIYFVCESEPAWGQEEMRRILVETRKKLDNIAEQHRVEIMELVEKQEGLVQKNQIEMAQVVEKHDALTGQLVELAGRHEALGQKHQLEMGEVVGRHDALAGQHADLAGRHEALGQKHQIEIGEIFGKHDALAGQHAVLVGRHEELVGQHGNLVQNPVPVGFVYPQLPGYPEPSALWPNIQWAEISGQFAGQFFRVVGGGAAEFGTVQAADSPRLTGVQLSGDQDFDTGLVNVEPGVWSPWLFSGANKRPILAHSYLVSNPEIRPVNTAMRIWARVA